MIGLDTNVLLRFLIQDDPLQAQIAQSVIAQVQDDYCFINNIVLCEVLWVLGRSYRLERQQLITLVEELLSTEQFRFEDPQLIHRALSQMKVGKADFADYLIGQINKKAEVSQTVTFDQKLCDTSTFQVLRDSP